MSEQSDTPRQTVEDALAHGIEARRGAAFPWSEQLRELGAIDRAVYQAVADTPTPRLDRAFRRLSTAANQSRLWLGIAAGMALLGGTRGRRAALDGVLAIGMTSASVNLGIKPLARRRRPARAEPAPYHDRYVPMPASTSFPSGHAASALRSRPRSPGSCRGPPCRSGFSRVRWPTRGCTPACTIPAMW